MDYKKLLINELEKKEILKQYGLLNEAPSTKNTTAKKIFEKLNQTFLFKGGYYGEKQNPEINKTISEIVNEINNFVKTKPAGGLFLTNVLIEAAESQLPNIDAESGKKSPSNRVNPGYLGNKRMNTIQTAITNALKKINLATPTVQIKAPYIGKTPFVDNPAGFCPKSLLPKGDTQGYACTDQNFNPGKGVVNWFNGKESTYKGIYEQFKSEQFIRASVALYDMSNIKACLTNLSFQINYEGDDHFCNNAVYEISIGAMPSIALKRNDGKDYASLNNMSDSFDNNPGTCDGKTKKGESCKRYNTFTITNDIVNQLATRISIVNLKPSIPVWGKCIYSGPADNKWGTGCHDGVGTVRIKSGNQNKLLDGVTTPKQKNKISYLFSFNPCDIQDAEVKKMT